MGIEKSGYPDRAATINSIKEFIEKNGKDGVLETVSESGYMPAIRNAKHEGDTWAVESITLKNQMDMVFNVSRGNEAETISIPDVYSVDLIGVLRFIDDMTK